MNFDAVKLGSELCEGYICEKVHNLQFGTRPQAIKLRELIHANMCGLFLHSQ